MADDISEGSMIADDNEIIKKRRKDNEKERSRDIDKHREKKRSRKRSRKARERSWTRSSSRSSSRSRSRSRKKSRRRRDYEEESASEEERGVCHRGDDPAESRNHERGVVRSKWNDGTPNNVLLIRNLSVTLVEDDVRNEFSKNGIPIREVRLMRSRDTGDSLRYCFVEFFSVVEAQYWMQLNQGEMRVDGGRTWYMYYSTTRRGNIAPPSSSSLPLDSQEDWVCTKCTCANFQRRTFCRRCSHAREDMTRRMPHSASVVSDGSDQVGCNPCNTLVLRGLDGLTTEESICTAIFQHAAMQVSNCRVMRDLETGASCGFALVEFASAREGRAALVLLTPHHNPLEVDGKALLVHYAKNNFNTAISTLEAPSQPIIPHLTMPSNSKDFSENTAAAVAQAAMMKRRPTHYRSTNYNQTYYPHHTTATTTTIPTTTTTTSNNAYPKYPTPDTSKFTFDEASGYYMDPSTAFYYDASTQYFYNAHKQHFMYWDADQHTYIPVATDNRASSTTTTTTSSTTTSTAAIANKTTSNTISNPESEKAKKIAKDMERWARRMNSQKEVLRSNNQPINQPTNPTTNQPTNQPVNQPVNQPSYANVQTSSGKNKLEELDEMYSSRNEMSVDTPPSPSHVFSISAEVPVPQEQQPSTTTPSKPPSPPPAFPSEVSMMDWDRLMCLLCKRAFLTQDTLRKHQQLSSLHKTNLTEYIKTHGSFDNESQAYRDRARERRKKFGDAEPSNKNKYLIPKDIPVAAEKVDLERLVEEDTVATRLMQRMGWKQGEGLGKDHQGIVTPIQATMRGSMAGLGSRVAEMKVDGQTNYNDRLKNTFRAYFNDIK